LVYEFGEKYDGVDLSSGLATGALPLPQMEGSPFYPFPIVPPAVSVLGSAVMSIDQGAQSAEEGGPADVPRRRGGSQGVEVPIAGVMRTMTIRSRTGV